MTEIETKKEVERILSSPRMIVSPSSNLELNKISFSNRQKSINRTLDKRNRKRS